MATCALQVQEDAMDPSGAEQPVGSSEADSTTLLVAEGGREGAEPEWFEHSAYERAESSYQRWLAGQWRPEPPDSDLNSLHGDQAGCHRQVSAMWVSAGACLPDFGPAERRPLVELPRTFLHTATAPHFDRGAVPTSSLGPAPKRRSRSGQPRLAPERQKNVHVEKPSHDQVGPASQAHSNDPAHSRGRGHAHSRRGGAPRGRGRGHRWQRKRWWSEGDGGSPWRQYGAQPSSMTAAQYLSQEKIWFDKSRYDEAERRFYEGTNGPSHVSQLKKGLHPGRTSHHPRGRHGRPGTFFASGDQDELVSRMRSLELENQSLQSVVEDLRSALLNLESRVALLERTPTAAPPIQTAPVQLQKARAPEEENGGDGDDDDDMDLFGSDEEDDEEAERIREERLKAYAEKKAQKPALIAKSSILLDVKPWDDETDMLKLEECVRSVQADGLLWGSSKLVPVGYGIKKLQIQCVVEDDKVGTDMLEEEITKFEDYVQSVDVAAFNKI